MSHNKDAYQNILNLIGRKSELFEGDINAHQKKINHIISSSKFLVLGAAGSIGQEVSKVIFKYNPKKLHIVDINENNLVELVRDIRSSYGYIKGDFKTFGLDIGSLEYDAFYESDGDYDYVLNLSALKHVRSEEDPYTLMRMINVNIFNTIKTIEQSIKSKVKTYFCVSTDKAADPINMMGASKRVMELFLNQKSESINITTARLPNVAFSNGSLLHSFEERIKKQQPIVAPNDIKRYFITPKESGELCLMSCLFGKNRDVYFPKLNKNLKLISFTDIAIKYLKSLGYQPHFCADENEARALSKLLPQKGQWSCLFSETDTTGEKDAEVFFLDHEILELNRYNNIGVIKNKFSSKNEAKLNAFIATITNFKIQKNWTKEELVKLFNELLPNFNLKETDKYLDQKM